MTDIISCKNWKTICDHIYCPVDGYDIVPDGGVVWCTLDDIVGFFNKIRGNNKKYIIVSSYSDFGLCYQKDNSPNDDLIRLVKLACHSNPTLGYTGCQIPPVCNTETCNPNDKYSIKCYRYTSQTFNTIPEEIKAWFCVNNTLPEYEMFTIPFGVPEGKESYFENIKIPKHKENKIYVNWSDNTLERALLKEQLKKEKDVVVEENNLEYGEFIERLLRYNYVLCPPGNGIDSYRILESIYCGCWPIVEDNMRTFDLCPKYKNVNDILWCIHNSNTLSEVLDMFDYTRQDYKKTKLLYWKERIDSVR